MSSNQSRLKGMLGAGEPTAAPPPIQKGMPFQVSTAARPTEPDLPAQIGELSTPLQEIARRYVGARRRSGEALLEAARWLTEARNTAAHGEWQVFLDTTNTSADSAERLLNIHATAMQNPQFADAVARNWLGQSVAALLARPSTPPEVLAEVLGQATAPRIEGVRDTITQARESHKASGQIPQNADFAEGSALSTPAPAPVVLGQIPQNADFAEGSAPNAPAPTVPAALGQIPQNADFAEGSAPSTPASTVPAALDQIPQNADFAEGSAPSTPASTVPAALDQIPQNADSAGTRVGLTPADGRANLASADLALAVLRETVRAVESLRDLAPSLDSQEGRALISRIRQAVQTLEARLP